MDEDDRLPICSTTKDAVDVSNDAVDQDPKQLEFTTDEETLIIRMHSLVGERWSLIAGRIPGRSPEEIEKYWNTRQSTSTAEKESKEIEKYRNMRRSAPTTTEKESENPSSTVSTTARDEIIKK